MASKWRNYLWRYRANRKLGLPRFIKKLYLGNLKIVSSEKILYWDYMALYGRLNLIKNEDSTFKWNIHIFIQKSRFLENIHTVVPLVPVQHLCSSLISVIILDKLYKLNAKWILPIDQSEPVSLVRTWLVHCWMGWKIKLWMNRFKRTMQSDLEGLKLHRRIRASLIL